MSGSLRTSQVAAAALLLAVAAGMCGLLVWDMTTTAFYGPPGHFTHSVRHQVYPHRAEALWIMAGLLGAVGVIATLRTRTS